MAKIMSCPKCGTKLEWEYTYTETNDGVDTTTRGYKCGVCGYETTRMKTHK